MNEEAARPGLVTPARVVTFEHGRRSDVLDDVATEEPLEIRIVCGGETTVAAVTMRTPGSDFELAAGFLYSEGVVAHRQEIEGITYCVDPAVDSAQRYNIVNVAVRHVRSGAKRLERHFAMSSACGVCGKATIESLQTRAEPIDDDVRVPFSVLGALPGRMREAQRVFAKTGGLHAAALFDGSGAPMAAREDVGRHNAFDKIVGWALLNGKLPLRGCIAAVSGRASYELVQKSIVARIPVVCAVSAPSSLAVSLAQSFGVTLAAFVRGERANVYSGVERVSGSC